MLLHTSRWAVASIAAPGPAAFDTTDRLRRVYLAQYSGEVIMSKDGTEPWGSFEQFLDGGKVVAATE